jgi:diguanylate cyclase (GGDEF)-like protein/PAS domain S-box-containing protein
MLADKVRSAVYRVLPPRPAESQKSATLKALPAPARVFVVSVIALAGILVVVDAPRTIPDLRVFILLLLGSCIASGMKLKLPLGTSSSNLSISYTFDFATLLLLGTAPATFVAGFSAYAQTRFLAAKRNPTFRVLFNISALIVTVQAAGATFTFLGGHSGNEFDLIQIGKPLVATALVYYLANSVLVATAVALATKQKPWSVWHSNFLWTAPSYFVGAGAAAGCIVMFRGQHGWLVPLAAAPVYLTFRSYRVYLDRISSEKRHNEEVLRLLDAARQSEQRYALAAAGSNDGLWDWDIPKDALYCSERWKLMFGLSAETKITTFHEWLEYVLDDDRAGLRKALETHLAGETPHFEHEYRVRHVNGEVRSVLCRGIAVRDESGRPVRMAGSQTDITEWRRVQETLAKAARHDPLTGLPNRMLFGELLQREMGRASRTPNRRYAVLFIDLDGFKLVNDSLGHLVGDQFLVAIAQRLQSRLRPVDALARLGGDEFAVLVCDINGSDDVTVVAERMQEALAEPFDIQGHEIYASASIGIVLGGDQYKSVSDLLRDADTAMYRSKSAGRGGYEMFDPAMHASAMNRLTLETELRRAVERDEFVVFFQPIVELLTSEVCGFEALVRWQRPGGSLAMPVEFIGVAEETGLIVPMTSYVLREAARQVAAWQKLFDRPNLYVSVNISSKLFARPDLIEEVEQAMTQSGIVPGTLCLEITESVLMKHSETVNRNFERLRQMRVPLYMDDFGTGYSSLSYLQKFPVDALKLDRSFVARLGTEDDCPIANVIATLARELGIGLIAEGVETEVQAEQLVALECPHAQGTLFSEPLAGAEVEKLLWEAGSRGLAAAS